MTAGSRIAATSRREARELTKPPPPGWGHLPVPRDPCSASRTQPFAPSPCPEPPPSAGVLLERVPEPVLAEVRPQRVREDELRVRGLPEQEIREPVFTRGADDEIGIGKVG